MATLFVSDLHLSTENSVIRTAFLNFLDQQLQRGDHLYILGDLFDFWLGDDAISNENYLIILALQALHNKNIKLSIMSGNHDFFYGSKFISDTNCIFLNDPCVINIDGIPILITHGDLLCTNDIAYQNFRKLVRDPAWQAAQLSKSPEIRLMIAQEFKKHSRLQTMNKSAAIMDVDQITVENMLREYRVNFIIHGHIHRYAEYHFLLDNQLARQIVLPNWYYEMNNHGNLQGGYLKCDSQKYLLINF